MQQVKARQNLKGGILLSVVLVGVPTAMSDEPFKTFVVSTVVCSVVLLVAAVIFRRLTRPGKNADG